MNQTESPVTIPHIAVLSAYFYPKMGGVENYAYLLAKQLHASGAYRVSIITSDHERKGYRKETLDGMAVYRLPIWFKISNTPINFFWRKDIKKIFAADRPDIIHTHSPVPFMADVGAKIAAEEKIPLVVTYHSGSMRKGRWFFDLIIRWYETVFLRALFERADAIVAISQNFAKRTFPQFAAKTYFIPTGVDLQRFKKTPLPTDTETVTYVGRIEHSSTWKGIEPLIQAMALVITHRPNAKLELIGGGDAMSHYRERTEALGIGTHVIMPGAQLGDALVHAYARANVVVLPSTSDAEAFSISLIEAMASGRPVIGTNIGGTPQVIEHENENLRNGFIVEPNNPKALAAAIEKILGDRNLAQRLGDNGAEKAQAFSWEIQAEKYRTLFEKVLKAGGRHQIT